MDDTAGPTPPAPEEEGGNLVERERDLDSETGDPTGRLDHYLDRTQTPLDILALLTLWIVVVPVADLGTDHDLWFFGYPFRLVLSSIYAVDMTIRTRLAPRRWQYLRTHPIGVLAIVFPPVRVLFSLRLIRILFQRGNLARFLVAALLLLVNGALMVWLFERDTPGANIETLGESIWWSVVTVTTVGYGDLYPVTAAGQVVATFIMLIGIVTVAVITAQVASSFVDQSARRKAARPEAGPATDARPTDARPTDASTAIEPAATAAEPLATVPGATTLAELDARLARIESLLVSLAPGSKLDDPPAPS